jgi:hypothetical protein
MGCFIWPHCSKLTSYSKPIETPMLGVYPSVHTRMPGKRISPAQSTCQDTLKSSIRKKVGAGANFHGRPVLSILAKFASTSDRHDYPTCATSTSARGSSVGYSDAHCALLTRDPSAPSSAGHHGQICTDRRRFFSVFTSTYVTLLRWII